MSDLEAIGSPADAELKARFVRLRRGAEAAMEARRAWRDPLLRRMLALADTVAAGLAALTFALAGHSKAGAWALLVLPGWILLAKLFGLYDRDQRALRHLTADELSSILTWSLAATAATALSLHLTAPPAPSLSSSLAAWVASGATAVALRSGVRALWRHLTPPERTLIVGRGVLADAVRRKLEIFPDIHVELNGHRDGLSVNSLRSDPGVLQGVERVILASPSISEDLLAELLGLCRQKKIKLNVVPPARGIFGTAVHLNHVADLPLIAYNTWDVSRSSLLLKRTFDLAFALAALILLAPLLAAAAAAVRLSGSGPVIYSQVRAGKDGRPFRIHKFRTMVRDAEGRLNDVVSLDALEEPMFKLKDDPRVTRTGRFLRRWSIDELPQLLDVLKGEMSFVGPRPEQLELVERYRPEHHFRLAVKPGITGPMQVYGRGELNFEERLAVEREYIENFSLARDVRILSLTLAAVVRGGGAY